ncbi:MAG: fibronectin type III domain-containing protein [Saccharospirillaceae bacterium]|nr:fibronectin type III domain-containing protein [Saccharospirillaceae bacterium]MCD8531800.1 fibronectin type III domain-containing protein [Saccharospirillaceae bacterium]
MKKTRSGILRYALAACLLTLAAGTTLSADAGTVASVTNLAVANTGGATQVSTQDGAFLYQINDNQPYIRAYRVDPDSGKMTAVGQYTNNNGGASAAPQFYSLAIDHQRNVVFAYGVSFTNVANFSINVFSINSDGTLTEISGSPFAVSKPNNKYGSITSPIAIDSTNGRLFLLTSGSFPFTAQYDCDASAAVITYSIADNGALSPIAGPTNIISNSPGIALSPDGKYLVSAGFNTLNCGQSGSSHQPLVVAYQITESGALGTSNSQPYPLSKQVLNQYAVLVQSPTALAMHPSNGMVYLLNNALTPSVFSLNNGVLTASTTVTSPANAYDLVFSAHGHRGWAISNSQIQAYQVNSDGSLNAEGSPLASAPAQDSNGNPPDLILADNSTRLMATIESPQANTWIYATDLPAFGNTTVKLSGTALNAQTTAINVQPGCSTAFSLSTTQPGSTTSAPADAFSIPATLKNGVITAAIPTSKIVLGTTYYVRAAATCNNSTLYSSALTYAYKTQPSAPSITSVSYVDVQPGATTATASVAIQAPASSGGSPITGYTVTSTPDSKTGSCAQSPCLVSGLTIAIPYSFAVSAQNAEGSSESSPVTVVPAPVAPATAPENMQVSFTPNGNTATINVSFEAPGNNGGASITAYNLHLTSQGKNYVGSCQTSRLTCTFSNATLGSQYYLTVSALNSAGPGNTATATVTPLAAPTVLSAIAGPVAGNATIEFTPDTASKAATTSYVVTSKPGNLTASCSASPCVISGLNTGRTYTFTMQAKSSAGTSSPSTASNSVTAGAATAVSDVQVSPGVEGVTVTFGGASTPNNNIEYVITNNITSTRSRCSALPCIVPLTQSGRYTFSVTTFDTDKMQVSEAVSATTAINAQVYLGKATATWSIPSGVQQLTAVVTGAGGGSGGGAYNNRSQGGNGAVGKVTLSVPAGSTSVSVIAGGGGTAAQYPLQGGNGGDASAIQIGSNWLLVAGGGGGGGAASNNISTGPRGGDAGLSDNPDGSAGYGRCPTMTSAAIPGSGSGGNGGDGAGGAVGGQGIGANASVNGVTPTNGGNANNPLCYTSKGEKLSVSGGGAGGGGFGGGGGGGGSAATTPKGSSWAFNISAGGGGRSTGPSATAWSSANNGGTSGSAGGAGSVIIYY